VFAGVFLAGHQGDRAKKNDSAQDSQDRTRFRNCFYANHRCDFRVLHLHKGKMSLSLEVLPVQATLHRRMSRVGCLRNHNISPMSSTAEHRGTLPESCRSCFTISAIR